MTTKHEGLETPRSGAAPESITGTTVSGPRDLALENVRCNLEVITTRDRILVVGKSWKEQYNMANNDWRFGDGRTVEGVQAGLDALDLTTATEDNVAEVIGNRSWTAITCTCCYRMVERVVRLPWTEDTGRLSPICLDCLKICQQALESRP